MNLLGAVPPSASVNEEQDDFVARAHLTPLCTSQFNAFLPLATMHPLLREVDIDNNPDSLFDLRVFPHPSQERKRRVQTATVR